MFDIVEKHVPKDKQTPKVYYFTQETFNEYQKQQNFQKTNITESEELYGISQAPAIKDLPKKPDDKTLFSAYAKAVLDETGQKWADKTNQFIAEKMLKNKEISPDQVKRALKHSREKIENVSFFVRKIENTPEIKAMRKTSRGMEM